MEENKGNYIKHTIVICHHTMLTNSGILTTNVYIIKLCTKLLKQVLKPYDWTKPKMWKQICCEKIHYYKMGGLLLPSKLVVFGVLSCVYNFFNQFSLLIDKSFQILHNKCYCSIGSISTLTKQIIVFQKMNFFSSFEIIYFFIIYYNIVIWVVKLCRV